MWGENIGEDRGEDDERENDEASNRPFVLAELTGE